MSAHPIFSRFKIDGLRGSTDIDVTIEDNVLVMVGENGSGKTTFLRILFYFLSGRWPRLAQFNFNRVSAIIDGQEYAVNHNDIKNILPSIDERNLSRLPISQRRHFSDLVETGRVEEANDLLNHLTLRYGLSVSKQRELPLEKLDTFGRTLGEIQEQLSNNLGSQILYLPTYRRIERELSSIVQGIDPDDLRRPMQINRQAEDANDYVELVEFGMNDVRKLD
jgi:predicted ATP-binding protein involved in virulence